MFCAHLQGQRRGTKLGRLMRTAPSENLDLRTREILEARLNLAACFRIAARMGMHEGICNHLSALVPGRSELFLSTLSAYRLTKLPHRTYSSATLMETLFRAMVGQKALRAYSTQIERSFHGNSSDQSTAKRAHEGNNAERDIFTPTRVCRSNHFGVCASILPRA
jgi:hypothetical protein